VAAALSLGAIGAREPPARLIALAAGLACAGLLGLSVTRAFWPASALLAGVGFAGTLVVAGCNTSLQLTAPDALRGRIMSLYTLLSGGIFPVSALFVGAVSEAAGVSRAFAVNGLLGLGALALLVWGHRDHPR
jgi:MFS family permease